MERKKAGNEDLKYFARTLARQAELSHQTVRSLAESSSTVNLTDEEFRGIGGLLNQSRVILTKYGRPNLAKVEVVGQVKPTRVRPSLPSSFASIRGMSAHISRQIDNTEVSVTESNDIVYVQHSEGMEMMTISFEYSYGNKSKSFNLYRKANEPLSSSFERMRLNLLKMKKPKKVRGGEQTILDNFALDVSIDIEGKVLDPDKTNNIDAWVEGGRMNLDGRLYSIRRNEPQVTIMRLPSIIMKGFVTIPDVNLANCDLGTCKLSWFRQISTQEKNSLTENDESVNDKIEVYNKTYWLYIGDGTTYSPSEDDVAHHIRVVCSPSDGTKTGLTYSCTSSGPVELGPPVCPFEKRQWHTKAKLTDPNELRLVSYNILADLYADSEYSRTVLFAHCPTHALDIDYRRQLLLKEIHGYNTDIVCLQEVDKKEFHKTFEPYFYIVSNHQSVFDTKGGQVAEGLATFFRRDRFELIASHRTILSKLIDPNASNEIDSDIKQDTLERHPILCDLNSQEARTLISKMDDVRNAIMRNSELEKRFMNRHTILQTTLLKLKAVKNKFVLVANTHLYFAPDADHVRLLQASVCVKYLEYLKDFYKCMIKNELCVSNPEVNIIFCGDMNSTPDCGLFKLMHEGQVPSDFPDWTSHKTESVVGLSVKTNLRFSSAYQDIAYTNYTPEFNGWLDYIYYELEGIDCVSTVPLPDHEDVIATEGLPSDVFPSDHIALIANLKLK